MGAFVVGLMGDIVWMDKKKTAAFTGGVTPLATALTTALRRNELSRHVLRGRLGYAPRTRCMST